MRVSVGLAVYNAERYLEQCLHSLVRQTCDDLEIIVVDDGSTDTSATICDCFASRDNRIRVIHKANGGLASARQVALAASTGDYFCVCDADDWVEPEMYERLSDKAVETGADIVMCGYWRECGSDHRWLSVYNKDIPSDNRLIVNDILHEFFPFFSWNKLFRRDLFVRYSLSWESGIDMGEDLLMSLRIFQHPVKLVCLPEPFYHYRRIFDGNSYTSTITLNSYNQMLFIRNWIDEHLSSNMFSEGRLHYQVNVAYAGLRVVEGMSSKYYRKTATSRLSLTQLLSEHTLKSFLILLTKLFGYRFGVFVNRMFYRMVYR